MKEFKINEFITIKLEHRKTNIFINGNLFNQCKILFLKSLKIDKIVDYIGNFNSIDEEEDGMKDIISSQLNSKIFPEVEFWGHCSNLQVWAENNYDTKLLHRNLAFPLLKKLTEVGDLKANEVFKEEIAKRLANGHPTVIEYLILEGYTKYLTSEELLYSVLVPEEADILLELEKYLKIENKENFWIALELEPELAPCFTVHDQHVVGIDLFECGLEILPEFISKLKFLTILSVRYNKLKSLPESLNTIQKLQEIHVDGNSIKTIPASLKNLTS